MVDKATFHVYLDNASGLTSVTLTLSRVLVGWDQKDGHLDHPARPGGRSTATVGTAAGWYAWDAGQIVKDWIENGSPNYGVVLSGPSSGGSYARRFTSREGGPAPRLEVSYYPPTPTPTDQDLHTDADQDLHADADRVTHRHRRRQPRPHDRYTHRPAPADADAHPHSDQNNNANPNTDAVTDSHAHGDGRTGRHDAT